MNDQTLAIDRRFDLTFAIAYGRCATDREHRLFARLDGFVKFVELAGGSAVLIGLWKEMPVLAAIAAIIVALLPIAAHIADLRGKSIYAQLNNEAFMTLREEASALSDDQLSRRLAEVQGLSTPDALKALRFVAYNDACDEVGATAGRVALTKWQRLIELIS